MQIEYEATFPNIDKNEIRERLRKLGAELIRPEFLQKRVNYYFPSGHEIKGGWLRVRDEADKITLSLKVINDGGIEEQKEICLHINSFNDARLLLENMGCRNKSYQETKREIWKLDGVEICIDEWPYVEPFVEVEGKSEDEVKNVSEKIGFNYDDARFCAVDTLYNEKYGISKDDINNTKEITFKIENPFLKIK
ncbi:MAG: hypothetical protein US63_C0026G0014 [Candidatus Moranbacteria bacterium GW2011_GWC2_37_8]|nr:MAG: hypothetical protein US63_C0026G0014 [Candidatus Moranbacteria bacterium GW2011_GWC2_37_8]KKQ62897.1 MAG: hypothetical protein US82_C0004G0014 [Parcubacteria group bacterium GW2011_GWC1_38_22]KKQ81473.1 MAG: hypothetical protein UT03_C0001G0013 [Candidatus Moranbacteria bacterium GW2011_GWD2_38_7]